MGTAIIPLSKLHACNPHRAWYTLGDSASGLPDGVRSRGQIEIVVCWRHNPNTPDARLAQRLEDEAEAERRRLEAEAARLAAEEAARDPRVVERRALDELYASTQHSKHAGDGWKVKINWLGTAAEQEQIDQRTGVHTDEVVTTKGTMHLVTKLDLPMNHLSGELTSSLTKLSRLQFLGMSHNDLHGTLPCLKSLTNLVILSLHHNKFTGEVRDHPHMYIISPVLVPLLPCAHNLPGMMHPT